MSSEPILLASYPRSGNTHLRTILWKCFGQRSASVYPRDFGDRIEIAEAAGHVEPQLDGRSYLPPGNLPLLKTHEPASGEEPAIYVVRDPRPTIASLHHFYARSMPLEMVIRGEHRFGTWAAHARSWHPWDRPRTLLLRHEQMVADHTTTVSTLSEFLDRPIIDPEPPSRDRIAGRDGRWVRPPSDWRDTVTPELESLIIEVNGDAMRELGYLD